MGWIYGFHPIREALRSKPQAVVRVRIDQNKQNRRRRTVEELCATHGVTCESTETAWFDSLASATHATTGISSPHSHSVHNGFAAELTEADNEQADSGARDQDLVVLAEDIQDPRNLGALVRVCEAAGVARVLVRDHGSTQADAVVDKTSAGATQHLPVERVTNSVRQIEELQEQGFWVYGADGAGRPPWEMDLTGKVAIAIGGEQDGLRRLTKERCDGLIGLPMRGQVESLNLTTAASAILYEAVRQRSRGQSP